MDYSTLAAWFAACPADLVAVDERWIGECYDQGTFTAQVVISGTTVDATRYVVLRCASGASFSTKAGVRTTALTYNTAGGVTIQGSNNLLYLNQRYTQCIGLQVKSTGYASCVFIPVDSCTIDTCIITSSITGTFAVDSAITVGGVRTVWKNCLFEYNFSANTALAIQGELLGCTVVNMTGTPGTSTALGIPYNVGIIKDTAVFGFNSFTSGTPAAGSDYNGTDNASAVTGAHNQTSLTFANEFQSTTNDFRAKNTGSLFANGVTDAAIPVDISVFTRASPPTIGAWEAAAPAHSFTIAPTAIPKNHTGNITLTMTGTGESWVNGVTVFTPSGVVGVTKISQNITGSNAATVVITDDATHTGTLTITESVTGSDTATTTIATATLTVSPSTGTVSTTPTLTLTGTNTIWVQETAAGLFSVSGVSGCSIGTPTVTTNTAATAVLTIGSSTGTLTITDNSTGATTTFTVNAVTGTITVTSPVQWQTYQRDAIGSGAGHANIPITGTYTGGPGTLTIEASFNGGVYATIATGSGGNFSGTLSTQAAGQGTLICRFVNAPGITGTVSAVGIGDVFVLTGQSNAVGVLDALQTYTNGSGLKATAYDTTAWVEGKDYLYASGLRIQGSFWPLLATHHMNDQGVPCCFVAGAVGGRALANDTGSTTTAPWFLTKYRPDTGVAGGTGASFGPGYTHVTTTVTNSGVNSVKCVLGYQGENDIDGTVDRWTYAAALETLADRYHADLAGSPKTVWMQLGYAGASDAAANAIRLACSDGIREGGNLIGMPTVYDLAVFGGVGGGNALHLQSQQDAQSAADRFWAVLKSEIFGGASGNGHGPRVVAIQYNAARTSITVTFDKVLKTGLTFATAIWKVTGNGVGATVNSVAYATDTNSVVLTLASAAALPILVSFGLGGTTAGLVVPLGPDFTLPGGAGTINLPAEPFSAVQAAPAQSGGGGSGALFLARGFGGGIQ